MKYKVCLIVDNPLRDLEGITLIAWHLAKQNISCFIVPMYCQAFDVLSIKPDLILVNYIRPNNVNLLMRYKKENIKIAVLDTEGSPGNDMDYFAKLISKIKHRNILDLYCLWGNDQYEAFKKNNVFKNDIITITGCPRYDFCSEPYSKTLPKVLDGSNFILINTTFPIGNPKFTKNHKFEEQAMIDMGHNKIFAKQYTKDSIEACKKMIEAVSNICKMFPQTKIILRPHPFESPEPYKSLNSYNNFEIRQEGSVIEWLNSCDVLLHLNCQTAIEAVMINKEPVSIEWINTPTLKSQAPPEIVSHTPKNLKELKALIHSIINTKKLLLKKDLIKSREALIRSRLFSNDGNSSLRVSDAINKILKLNTNQIECNFNKTIKYKKSLKQTLREILGYNLFHKVRKIIQGNKSEFRRKEKSFSNSDVSKIITRLNQTTINKQLITVFPINTKDLSIPRLFSNQTIKVTNEK